MALLPGLPTAGGAGPTLPNPARGHTGSTGIAKLAHAAGKPGHTQHMGSLVGGMTPKSAINGAPTGAYVNNYTKGSAVPATHPGSSEIRGTQMGSHIRQGGLGPGKIAAAGPSDTDYSMSNPDQE